MFSVELGPEQGGDLEALISVQMTLYLCRHKEVKQGHTEYVDVGLAGYCPDKKGGTSRGRTVEQRLGVLWLYTKRVWTNRSYRTHGKTLPEVLSDRGLADALVLDF